MFSLTVLVAICVTLPHGLIAEESKPCYDWEKSHKEIKEICHECKKAPNKLELNICLNEKLKVVDEEGNIVPSKIRDIFLEELDETKIDAMKEALKDCGKDVGSLKINEENFQAIEEIWGCADKALIKICPETNEQRKLYENDEDMKGCMTE